MFYCDKCNHREIKKRHIIHHINEKHKGKPTFTHKKSVINFLVDPKDVLPRKKSNSKLIENMLSAYYSMPGDFSNRGIQVTRASEWYE